MRNEYLGDAFDHWKGSLILRLSKEKLIRELKVVPMITDDETNPLWNEKDMQTYAQLLNIKREDIINESSKFENSDVKRKEYFKYVVSHKGDFFLDPDTGIEPQGALKKHVKFFELKILLENTERILMVYQHTSRWQKQNYKNSIRNIKKNIKDVSLIIYKGGQVSMFFISRNKKGIQKIKTFLCELLQGTAACRII